MTAHEKSIYQRSSGGVGSLMPVCHTYCGESWKLDVYGTFCGP